MKSWLQDNDIEIYSTYNEGKSLLPEIFARTLRNKIIWITKVYDVSIKKYIYTDKTTGIVKKYSNTYHSTSKMKAGDETSSTYIDFK